MNGRGAHDLAPIVGLRALGLGNNAIFEVTSDQVDGHNGRSSGRSGGRFVLLIHRPGFRTVAHPV